MEVSRRRFRALGESWGWAEGERSGGFSKGAKGQLGERWPVLVNVNESCVYSSVLLLL